MMKQALLFFLFIAFPVMAQEPKEMELDLRGALEKAQLVSLNVLLADARVEESIARLQQSRSLFLPQISGAVTAGRQTKDLRASGLQFPGTGTTIGPYNSFDARGRVTQTIFDAAAFERFRAARLGETLTKVELEKAKQDVLALAATFYIQAKRAEEHLQAIKMTLRRDDLGFKIQETKFTQGIGSSLSLKEAKANREKSRYYYQVALSDALQKQLDLKALLRIPAEVRIIFLKRRYQDLLGALPLKEAAVKLLDVQTAQAQFNFQQAQTNAAKADFGPRISLFGDYGRSGASPDRGSNTYSIGLQATVPVWEGGLKTATLKQEKAKLKESQLMRDDASIKSLNNIIEAQTRLKDARFLILAQMSQVAALQEEINVIKQRLALGIAQELDMAKTKAKFALAVDDYNDAVAYFWMAKIELAHAQGQMNLFLNNGDKS